MAPLVTLFSGEARNKGVMEPFGLSSGSRRHAERPHGPSASRSKWRRVGLPAFGDRSPRLRQL